MPTVIDGDDIRCPGYIFLENPLIGAERVIATGPNGEIISTQISITTVEMLLSTTADPTPDTLTLRTPTGGGRFQDLDVVANGSIGGLLIDDIGQDIHQSMLSIQMGLPVSEGVGLTIKARDGQTANFFQWTDTSGTPIGWVHPDGTLFTSYLCLPLLADPGAMAVCGATDGQVIYNSQAIRIKSDKMQMKNLDDGLFYDVVLRNVAGVPTLSVEGAGEA